jgi:hypothetical protein
MVYRVLSEMVYSVARAVRCGGNQHVRTMSTTTVLHPHRARLSRGVCSFGWHMCLCWLVLRRLGDGGHSFWAGAQHLHVRLRTPEGELPTQPTRGHQPGVLRLRVCGWRGVRCGVGWGECRTRASSVLVRGFSTAPEKQMAAAVAAMEGEGAIVAHVHVWRGSWDVSLVQGI